MDTYIFDNINDVFCGGPVPETKEKVIKSLLSNYGYSDDDLKVIADFSDDFTIAKIKENPDEFVHEMVDYLDPHKLDEEFSKSADYCNNDMETYHSRIFELILSGKGYSKKEIDLLYENDLIPFDDNNQNMSDDDYYDRILEKMDDIYSEIDDEEPDLDEYYDTDLINDLCDKLLDKYETYMALTYSRVIFELDKIGLTREKIERLDKYISKDDIDLESIDIYELAAEIDKVDKYYDEHTGGSYYEDIINKDEEAEAAEKETLESYTRTYKELYPTLTDEQVEALVHYSDEFTINKAKTFGDNFLKHAYIYIKPSQLINDKKYRKTFFKLIMTNKGFSNEEINKIYERELSPLDDNCLDIISEDYYEKLKKEFSHFDYEIKNDHEFEKYDSYSKICRMYYNSLDNNDSNIEVKVPYLRLENDLIEGLGFDKESIRKLFLYCELGYFKIYKNSFYYKRDVDNQERIFNYRREDIYNTKYPYTNEADTLAFIAGYLATDYKRIINELEVDQEFIDNHGRELRDLVQSDYSSKKLNDILAKYKNYRNEKVTDLVYKRYKKVLTKDQVHELVEQVENSNNPFDRIDFNNLLSGEKVLKDKFDRHFYPLIKTNKINAKIAISSVTMVLGGAILACDAGLIYVFSGCPEFLSNNSNIILQKISENPKMVWPIFAGGMFVMMESLGNLIKGKSEKEKNKREVEMISESYHIEKRR